MAVMTNKIAATEALRRIGEAIDESILAASSEELREEVAAQKLDVDKVVVEMDAITASAKMAGAKMRLEQAKEAVKSFKARTTDMSSIDRDLVRRKLSDMQSSGGGNVPEMMRAARKGKGISDRDEEGAIDDLAQLEALEAQEPQADGE